MISPKYITYDDYIAFGGELSDTAFHRFAFQSEKFIDQRTSQRVRKEFDGSQPYTNSLFMLCFELINLFASSEITPEIETASESTDGWSKSYRAKDRSIIDQEMLSITYRYLDGEVDTQGVPLLWTGVY